MYINMMISWFLIPSHCTHTEIFLKEAEILLIKENITFDEFEEVLQYDLEDLPE